MKIEEINLYKYTLPLNRSIIMKGHIHEERNGLIVEVVDSDNNVGYGEAAPLPGLHHESLDEIIYEFHKIKSSLLNIEVKNLNVFSMALPGYYPILHFAVEWAIIDLISKIKNVIPADILNPSFNKHITINPLLIGNFDNIVDHAKEIKKQKPQSVKIKVGSRPLEDDIYLVKIIDDIFENKVNLRLDANRSWSLNQAITFGHAILSTNLEYIEEPLDDPLLLETFYKKTGVQYALDETLSEYSSIKIPKMEGISAFIIKPSVIGSLRNIKSWVDLANRANIRCVFSNTFESGIGLWSNTCLAAAFSNEKVSHGLDTYSWLKADLIFPAFSAQNLTITLPDNPDYFTVNHKSLTPIDL